MSSQRWFNASIRTAAVGCLCLLAPSLASATPVVLFSTRDVTSSADINFTGSVVSAINLNGSPVTIGGVNFIGGFLAGLNNGGFGDANLGSPEMNNLFNTSRGVGRHPLWLQGHLASPIAPSFSDSTATRIPARST